MMECDSVSFSRLGGRLDASYHVPVSEILRKLKRTSCKLRSIGELTTDVHRGVSPDKEKYLKKGIPALKTANITEEFVNWRKITYVSEQFYLENTTAQPEKHNVLITSTGVGSAGKADIFDFDRRCHCTAKITIVKVKDDEINPYYLTIFLKSKYGKPQLEQSARGSTGQVEIYGEDVRRVVVPIAKRQFQDNIAESFINARRKMRLAEEKFDNARKILDGALNINPSMFKSPKSWEVSSRDLENRLDATYYKPEYAQVGRFVNSMKERKVRIGDQEVGSVFKGITPGLYEYTETGLPIVKTASITGQGIDWNRVDYVPRRFVDENSKFKLERNDVLVTCTGEGSIGKADIFTEKRSCLFVAELSAIRLKSDEIDPFYLYMFLNSKVGRLQLLRSPRGATGQMHLYPKAVESIKIPVIDSNIQQELNKTVSEFLVLKEQAREILLKVKSEVEGLVES